MKVKPVLCVDFKGGCCKVSRVTNWTTGYTSVYGDPTPGLFEFLNSALETFRIQIVSELNGTPSGKETIRKWLSAVQILSDDYRVRNFDLDQLDFPVDVHPNCLHIHGNVKNLSQATTAIMLHSVLESRRPEKGV